jgi:outer membrane lipoprotein-sorting protein
MNSADKIKRFFKNAELGINSDADEKVFNDVLAQQKKIEKLSPCFLARRPALRRETRGQAKARGGDSIWRITMKSPITKIAVATLLIIACLMGVFMFNQTSGVAWAIEQSIEAASQYKAILIEGFDTERTWRKDGSLEQRPYKSWAVANGGQTMIERYRHEVDGVPIITTNGQKTWRYDPNTNTVHIENRPYIASECWCGSQLLEQLKGFHDSGVIIHWEVTYDKDPATGKQRAHLRIAWLDERYNGPRSLLIEFDMESKLPVSFKQWENPNWEGQATLVGEKIKYYENLPDGLFEFEIPEGATVIEN